MKCENCNKEITEDKYYMWQGLSGEYCSPSCAAYGCPNGILLTKRQESED